MSLTNSPSVETYKAYAEALNALDIDRTRTYLHDDLTYQGPVGETQGADAYLKSALSACTRKSGRSSLQATTSACLPISPSRASQA